MSDGVLVWHAFSIALHYVWTPNWSLNIFRYKFTDREFDLNCMVVVDRNDFWLLYFVHGYNCGLWLLRGGRSGHRQILSISFDWNNSGFSLSRNSFFNLNCFGNFWFNCSILSNLFWHLLFLYFKNLKRVCWLKHLLSLWLGPLSSGGLWLLTFFNRKRVIVNLLFVDGLSRLLWPLYNVLYVLGSLNTLNIPVEVFF